MGMSAGFIHAGHMMVLAITGILAAVALPNGQRLIQSGHPVAGWIVVGVFGLPFALAALFALAVTCERVGLAGVLLALVTVSLVSLAFTYCGPALEFVRSVFSICAICTIPLFPIETEGVASTH